MRKKQAVIVQVGVYLRKGRSEYFMESYSWNVLNLNMHTAHFHFDFLKLTLFSSSEIVCPLITIPNGHITFWPSSRKLGATATHYCNNGYWISSGSQQRIQRTCTSTRGGSWSGERITCVGEWLPSNLTSLENFINFHHQDLWEIIHTIKLCYRMSLLQW